MPKKFSIDEVFIGLYLLTRPSESNQFILSNQAVWYAPPGAWLQYYVDTKGIALVVVISMHSVACLDIVGLKKLIPDRFGVRGLNGLYVILVKISKNYVNGLS